MLPEGKLSTRSVIAPSILGGRNRFISPNHDYEDGPIDLNDPSSGLFYQIWGGISYTDGIKLFKGGDGVGTQILAALNIVEMSFSFDQNGRPAIGFLQNGQAKIYWYDSTIPGPTTTVLGTGITSPKVILDDKRQTQTANSDVIMGYIKNRQLCYRQQRDRFMTEYVLASNVDGKLHKIGMGNNLRLQFIVTNY